MTAARSPFVVDVARRAASVSIHRMAAALAFYALFALPPLVVVAMHVSVWLLDDPAAARQELQANVSAMPEGFQETVGDIIESVEQHEPKLVFARFLSYAVILFAATAGFSHLQWMLNRIWDVPRRRKRAQALRFVLKRGVGFVVVVVGCLVLVGSASLGVALRTVPDLLLEHLPASWSPHLAQALNDAGFFFLGAVFFALLFWILPDAKVGWRAAFAGALTTSALLVVGKYALIAYLNHSWKSVAFGAAGSLVATLSSMFVGALVVLLGGVVGATVASRRAAVPPQVPVAA